MIKKIQKVFQNKARLTFAVIIILAFFFRFFDLSSVPPSSSLDEVSIGYNAYSILETGRDEYGYQFPILLRAYDDWRPALYVYLVIPFIKLIGLETWVVRFPSVLLSIITLLSVYFLTKKIFQDYFSEKVLGVKAEILAFITVLLLAISPWHIYISRLGHEANAGLAFFVFGLTFFFYNRVYLAILFFVLSFISYQSEKIFLPFFILVLLILFKQKIWKFKKQVIIGCIFSFIILIPFFQATFSDNALIRFKGTNIFEGNRDRFEKQTLRYAEAVKTNNLFDKIIYNRRILAMQLVAEAYISHFNPVWLFTNLSADKHKVPNIGLLYLWEAPFILAGILYLFKKKINIRVRVFFFLWIFLAPLPGAITTDSPHAMRTYTFIPILQIVAALGIVYVYQNLIKKIAILTKIVPIFSIIIVAISVGYLYYNYFIIFPKTQSSSFQYALKNSIEYVNENKNNYKKIIFSNENQLYQSYMFFLFYSKYNPARYLKEGGTVSGGFAENHKFDKYEFRKINWSTENKYDMILYIGNITDFPSSTYRKQTFSNLDNAPTIIITQ